MATTNGRGYTTAYTYDAAGRRTTTTDALGNSWSSVYDANGNEISTTDPRGHTTTFTYDALDRLIATQYPDGTTSTVLYDAHGHVAAETDAEGLNTEFAYDANGRLLQVTDALGQVTRYGFDEVGNRTRQTDANGHTTLYEYDAMGRQTRRILPDGAAETMTYHVDGTLASHMDFNGVTRTYEYDAAKRLIRRAYPDGSEDLFTYTPSGQRASATHAGQTTTNAYDPRGRLIEKVDPTGHKLSYTYDSQGGVTSLAATVGTQTLATAYVYDALDRPIQVTDAEGEVTEFTYDASGNTAGIAYPNALSTSFTADSRNRITHLATVDGSVLQSHGYTLGPTGNRTSVTEQDGTIRSYGYDDLYQLTREKVVDATATLVYQKDFSYDAVGNRLQQIMSDGGTPTTIASSYDPRNRLLVATTTTYGWDSNGNQLSRAGTGSRAYTWDFENRLTSVTLEDGSVTETTYDADGNRLKTTVTLPDGSSDSVDYLIDTSGALSHVVAEIQDGQIETLYTRAGDQLISLYRPASAERRTYHGDALGSVRLLTDDAGAVTDRYTYSAFGELLEHTGSDPQPYRFAGEAFDTSTGDSYNRARWMDPAIGRFLSMDPFEGLERRPATLHPYVYALNRPTNLVDPSGLLPPWLARILAGGAVHREIGRHFVLNVEAGQSDRWISTIADVEFAKCKPNRRQCRRRPDLASRITGEVYEIKTTSPLQYAQGFRQLSEYIHLLRLNAPQIAWRPGISYKPQRIFTVTGKFGSYRIRTFGPRVGLIQYTATSTTRLRTPGPGVSIAIQQTLIVALMLASLMAAMRRPV